MVDIVTESSKTNFRRELAERAIENDFGFQGKAFQEFRNEIATRNGLTSIQGGAIQAWFAIYPTTLIEAASGEKFSFRNKERKLWNVKVVKALLEYHQAPEAGEQLRSNIIKNFIEQTSAEIPNLHLDEDIVARAFLDTLEALFFNKKPTAAMAPTADKQTGTSRAHHYKPIKFAGLAYAAEGFQSAHLPSLDRALKRSIEELIPQSFKTKMSDLSRPNLKKILQPFNGFYNIVCAFISSMDAGVIAVTSLTGDDGVSAETISKMAGLPLRQVCQSIGKLEMMGLLKGNQGEGYVLHKGLRVGALVSLLEEVAYTAWVKELTGEAIQNYCSSTSPHE